MLCLKISPPQDAVVCRGRFVRETHTRACTFRRPFSLSTPWESIFPRITAGDAELSTYRRCERRAHCSSKVKICSVFSGRTDLYVRFPALFPSWFLCFYTHPLILRGTRVKNSFEIRLRAPSWEVFVSLENEAGVWLRNFWNIQIIGVLLGFSRKNC